MEIPNELEERAKQYLNQHRPGAKLYELLGYGTDGAVWATSYRTALKVFERDQGYYNERDCYRRLAEYGVTRRISDFWVAEMHGCDDLLMVVEMDIMQEPPFVIDFAKSKIDRPPDFSKEVLAEQEIIGRDLFDHNWPAVVRLLDELESYLIYYLDPKPHNIVFPPD